MLWPMRELWTQWNDFGFFCRPFRGWPCFRALFVVWLSAHVVTLFAVMGLLRRLWLLLRQILESIFYTMVSISSSSCFKDESCLVWPFLSDPWIKSGAFTAKAKLNRLFLRKEPFWITTLSACLLSLAKWRSSFLWRCLSTCIRREQFILKMATILDISAFSSSLYLINSTRLGSEWYSFVPTRKSRRN